MSPIEQLIRELQKAEKAAGLAAYRADQQVRTDLYAGKYESKIRKALARRMPLSAADFDALWVNVYRKVIDERAAGLYRTEPARVVLDPSGEEIPDSEAMIDALIDRKTLNVKLDKAARYLEAHRTILLSVAWRHNRVEIDVLTPPLFHVVQGDPDPTCLEDAEAVIVHLSGHKSTPEHANESRSIMWYRGEDDEPGAYHLVNDKTGKVIESADNPYWNQSEDGTKWGQVFPFVLLQAEDPDADLYISGGDDLVRAALHVGFTLTDMEYVERFQSYGQAVFNGVDPSAVSTMKVGPNSAIALGAVGQESFNFVTPPQTTANRMGSLGSFLRFLAYTYDLPADTFDDTRLPTSGTALRISRKKLAQYRSDLANRMAVFEERLFSIMRAVRNAHVAENQRTPWNYSYRVTPAPQEIALDVAEQDTRNAGRIALGLDSAVGITVREQGVSEERAREIVAQNRADNGPQAPAPTPGAPAPTSGPGGGILGQMRANLAARQDAVRNPAPAMPPPAPMMPKGEGQK